MTANILSSSRKIAPFGLGSINTVIKHHITTATQKQNLYSIMPSSIKTLHGSMDKAIRSKHKCSNPWGLPHVFLVDSQKEIVNF